MANHATTAPAPQAAALQREPMTHRQILEALTGLLAALFTAILSSTIVANALPTIMSELHGVADGLCVGHHGVAAGHRGHHPHLGQAFRPVR